MSEVLRGLAIASFGGLIAGLLSPALVLYVAKVSRDRQGRLDSPILERKAAKQAKLYDFPPVVDRLCRKEEILPYPATLFTMY
jgi:hypothetical protein